MPQTRDRARHRSWFSDSLVSGAFFLIVLALGLIVYLTPLKTWLHEGEWIKTKMNELGYVAPLVFTSALALLSAIGAPRLLLCSLSGMVFGLAWGLIWSQLGTLLGAYLTFVVVRCFDSAKILKRFPRLRRLSQTAARHGLLSVVIVRQLPMSGFYNNVLLGLTQVGHRSFLIGSAIGFLPLGVTATLIGAGLFQGDATRMAEYLGLALGLSLLLGYLLKQRLPAIAVRRQEDSL